MPCPRAHSVGWNIFKSVTRPDVHDAFLPQFFCQILRNANAGLSVFDPEGSRFGIGAGKRQGIAHGVREEGGVKIASQTSFLAEINPFFKMLGFDLIAVNPTAVFLVKNGVAGMQIEFLFGGTKLQSYVQVCHQLTGGGSASRVVSGRLNSARRNFLFFPAGGKAGLYLGYQMVDVPNERAVLAYNSVFKTVNFLLLQDSVFQLPQNVSAARSADINCQ